MRHAILATFAAAGLLSATAAFADDARAPAMQQASAPKTHGDEIVCKAIVHEGILNGNVVCHTRNRWDTIRRGTAREFNDFQLRALTTPMRM